MTPQPFCFNKSRVRAIVLGADPTNYSDGGNQVQLQYAFGIGLDPRYFNGILENLNLLGLHLEDLYIDNLLPDYQKAETGKNKDFVKDAKLGIPDLLKRFATVKGSKSMPVFLTSYEVYKAVLKGDDKIWTAGELYNLETDIPIPASANSLGRPLIPLFRHTKYNLNKQDQYRSHVLEYL